MYRCTRMLIRGSDYLPWRRRRQLIIQISYHPLRTLVDLGSGFCWIKVRVRLWKGSWGGSRGAETPEKIFHEVVHKLPSQPYYETTTLTFNAWVTNVATALN